MDICILSLFILWNALMQICCGELAGIEVVTQASRWHKYLCYGLGKHLLSLQADQLKEDVNNLIQEESIHSGLFWIGGKRRSSTWAWTRNGRSVNFRIRYRGCIPVPDENGGHIRPDAENINSTISCISYCMTDTSDPENIKYIGLHQKQCYCLRLKDVALCSMTCGRNNSDSCGGENEFSIYEKQVGSVDAPYKESCTGKSDFSSTNKKFQSNSLKRCAEYCDKLSAPIPYILLQNETCMCLKDLNKNLSRTVFYDNSFCGIPCTGSDEDWCGGFSEKPLISVYEIKDRAVWEYGKKDLSDHTKNCVNVIWDSMVELAIWNNDDCTTKNPFICQTANGSKVVHAEKKSWFDARKVCISEGGDLLKYTMFNDSSHLFEYDYYWIGLQRYGWTWVDETDVIGIEVLQKNYTMVNQCLALRVLENGSYQLLGKDCSINLPYICYGNDTGVENTLEGKHTSIDRKSTNAVIIPGAVRDRELPTRWLRIFLIAGGTIAGGLILMISFIVICVIQSRTMDVLRKRRAVYHVLEKNCEEKCDPKTCKCRHCNEQYRNRGSALVDSSIPNGGNLYEAVENEQNKHSELQRQSSTQADEAFPYDSLFMKKKKCNNNSKDNSEDICMQETEKETFDHIINGQSNHDQTDGNLYDKCGNQHTPLNPKTVPFDPTYAQAQT